MDTTNPTTVGIDPDVAAAFAAHKAQQGQAVDPDVLAAFHAHQAVNDGNPLHAEYAKGLLGPRMARENQNDQEQAQLVPYGQQVAGGLSALAGAIPGALAAEAFARSKIRKIPYETALQDIRGAQNELPFGEKTLVETAGAAPLAALIPGTPAVAGGSLGGASGLAAPDKMSMTDRVKGAAENAALGAVAGKVLDLGTTALRAKLAPSLGENALARKAAMNAADKSLYGQAATEGVQATAEERAMLDDVRQRMAAVRNAGKQLALPAPGQSEVAKAALNVRPLRGPGGQFASPPALPETLEQAAARDYTNILPPPTPAEPTPPVYDYTNPRPVRLRAANDVNVRSPAITAPSPTPKPPTTSPLRGLRDALQAPVISDYADAVLNSPRFANADAPTIAQEIYRQMSADQRMLSARSLADPSNFKPAAGLKAADIATAKQQLLDAMDGVAPSFRKAVEQHATLAGEQRALETGADAARRAMGSGQVAGKKLTTASVEAALQQLQQMAPNEAQAASEGILGRLGPRIGPSWKPWTGFGIPYSLTRTADVMPLLRAADQSSGALTPQALRALVTALAARTSSAP